MRNNAFKKLLPLLILTACGGGGGGGGGYDSGGGDGGYNPNNAPVIDGSTTTYSVLENQTSAFTVLASDADFDTLTYTISAGDDSALMSIDSSGVVTFISSPDFEAPSDANTDNNYQITVTVSDGSLSDSENFTVTVTNLSLIHI